VHGGSRNQIKMMPIGVPRVAYRVPEVRVPTGKFVDVLVCVSVRSTVLSCVLNTVLEWNAQTPGFTVLG
jgi:hypothetical protein